MTISDEAAPQDRDSLSNISSHLDIADLIRTLDERAKAADERAQALAERVSLLESQITSDAAEDRPSLFSPFEPESTEKRPSLYTPYESEREIGVFETRPNVRLELGTGSIQNLAYNAQEEDAIQTVVGVSEDPNHRVKSSASYLKERLDQIEDRLIDCEDAKRGTFYNNEYILPESTFSLLVTEHPLSSPFIFAIFTAALSLTCLALVLADSVQNGTVDNRINIPPGVSNAVRAAQFVGILVGVLFEDECPQGLQHIAFGAGHKLLLDGTKKIHKRLIAVSLLRLAIGYMFLTSLFINVVQNSDVIGIFYDVLALEFVENIDDTAFALAKKGFLGQKLLVATVKRHTIEIPMASDMRRSVVMSRDLFGENSKSVSRDVLRSGTMISNSRSNNLARLLYFLNGIILLSGLTYLSVKQSHGEYRCRRIDVSFGEEIWESATVVGSSDTRLLVYPYFNGIYEAYGIADGHPRYVEQDKYNGNPFVERTGAEIRFCEAIESWVFMHPDIVSDNECKWLFRSNQVSSETDYDIIEAANDPWTAWVGHGKVGEAVFGAEFNAKCTACLDNSDCSYQGTCVSGRCSCYPGREGHFCEFERPCDVLATEKAEKVESPGGELWVHENAIVRIGGLVYDRPIYIQKNLTGDPFDWRKFDVRQRQPTSTPSIFPSTYPTNTVVPTTFATPTVGTNKTMPPTPGMLGGVQGVVYSISPTQSFAPSVAEQFKEETPSVAPPPVALDDDLNMPQYGSPPGNYSDYYELFPTNSPSKPSYTANEYETDVEDFAEHDDFFESKPLHDGLEEIMTNYSVVMSFTGSRFYANIVEANATESNLFPIDYHAFWDNAFNINRTFSISSVTDGGTPIGIDFFEMRRRVPSDKNENVQFAYGPYGALIPNMAYEGAGFFHCLNSTT